MLFAMNKELKKKINQANKEIIAEEKRKRELVNRNLNYDFLQQLINRCDENPGLVMKIMLKDGTVIQMCTQKQYNSYSEGYDGEPSVAEIEVK